MNKKEIAIIVCIALIAGIKAMSMTLQGAEKLTEQTKQNTVSDKSRNEIVCGTMDLKKFDKLEIDVASIDTYICVGDSYSLEYRVYEKNTPIVKESGNTLSIKQPNSEAFFWLTGDSWLNNEEQYYKLTVPGNAGIIDADIDMASGKMNIDSVAVDGNIRIASGEVKLKESKADKLHVYASSGKYFLDKCEYSSIELDIVSGNVTVEDSICKDLSCYLTSGNMDFRRINTDKARFDITSGKASVDVIGDKDDYSYDLKAVSGSIKLDDTNVGDEYRSDDKKNKEIRAELTSGSISIDFSR